MLIVDRIIEEVEPIIGRHARELDVSWHVNIELVASPDGPVPGATFVFCCPSPIIGQALWTVHVVRAEIAFDSKALEHVVRDGCESLRSRRAGLLAAASPLEVPR